MGSDLQVWGDPLLRWEDRRDPTSTLFTLDDGTEEIERENIDMGVMSELVALNNAMGMLRDVITPTGQVPRDPAPQVSSLAFRVSKSLFPL